MQKKGFWNMELETMEESVRSSRSNGTPSRHEKSLGLLTIKFVTLLQEAKDGVLDLKLVSEVTRRKPSGVLVIGVGVMVVVVLLVLLLLLWFCGSHKNIHAP